MSFKEGYKATLHKVKYFINYITDRAQYADNLVFEAYDVENPTDAQITTIFTVDNNVHEGWNYYEFDADK